MKTLPLTGAYASAHAMRQINPDVVAAYPITPQTPIVEKFAEFVANGLVTTKTVEVESEHSAMSVLVGAASAGARAMGATSSQGLALMWEVVMAASGLRLPIVMNIVNRALSAPINIHCDHSDTMGARDTGWIQIASETAQEAYEHTIMAIKYAEHPEVLLPVMVLQDGFITSHGVENVTLYDDDKVREFVGDYKAKHHLFDIKNPITIGPLQLPDYYFETKRQQQDAMEKALKLYPEIAKMMKEFTGKDYGYYEPYYLEDAEVAIVVMNSAAGTTKAVIDRMRKEGKKVGLLKIRLFRPFPYEHIAKALEHVENVAILDRSLSFGALPPLFADVKNAIYDLQKRPKLNTYVYGLGGRDLYEKEIEKVFNDLLEGKHFGNEIQYIGLRDRRYSLV